MPKLSKLSYIPLIIFVLFNCSPDEKNDCPDIIEIDINDPESIKQAEKCGLSPAEPLGTIWVSESYRLSGKLKKSTTSSKRPKLYTR